MKSDQGVLNLAWEVSDEEKPESFELQQSGDIQFPEAKTRLRYRGLDRGSVVSGLAEGIYHFRVRAVEAGGPGGGWSEPVSLEVEYMAKPKVVLLLAAGAVVFVATLAALLIGHFRSARGMEEG